MAARKLSALILTALLTWVVCSYQNNTTGVLFIFDSWSVSGAGLQGFHRTLIKDLQLRKNGTLKLYSTVLNTQLSKSQIDDALSLNMTLITATIEEDMRTEEKTLPLSKLIYHETLYPELRTLENIQYIVGYAPKTAEAACRIRRDLFPNSTFVLIIHVNPDTDSCPSSQDVKALREDMRQWASQADITYSIGPSIYDSIKDIVFRNLREKPHYLYLPRPDNTFFLRKAVLPRRPQLLQLFSYGKIQSPDELEKTGVILAIADAGGAFRYQYDHPPIWLILGFQQGLNISGFIEKLDTLDVKHLCYEGMSLPRIAEILEESHLCIITTCYKEYSFDGLEAMAIGVPLLAPRNSHIALYIKRYFPRFSSHYIVENEWHWSDRITNTLSRHTIERSFQVASDLRDEFQNNRNVSETHSSFAAIFKTPNSPPPIMCHKDNCTEDLYTQLKIDSSPFHEMSEAIERQGELCRQYEGEERKKCIEQSTKKKQDIVEIKQHIDNIFEKQCHDIQQCPKYQKSLIKTCITNHANKNGTGKGSLIIKPNLSSLLHLYMFEGKYRSGNFSAAIEPLLITNEMTELAWKLNITLKLQVVDDPANFKAVERFFMLRDGGFLGENQSIYDNDIFNEDTNFDDGDVHLTANLDTQLKIDSSPFDEKLEDIEHQGELCRQYEAKEGEKCIAKSTIRKRNIAEAQQHIYKSFEKQRQKIEQKCCITNYANLKGIGSGWTSWRKQSIYDNDIFKEDTNLDDNDVHLIASYDGRWMPNQKDETPNVKTLVLPDSSDGVETYTQKSQMLWSWFICWINPLYVMDVIAVIVVIVTIKPSEVSRLVQSKARKRRTFAERYHLHSLLPQKDEDTLKMVSPLVQSKSEELIYTRQTFAERYHLRSLLPQRDEDDLKSKLYIYTYLLSINRTQQCEFSLNKAEHENREKQLEITQLKIDLDKKNLQLASYHNLLPKSMGE